MYYRDFLCLWAIGPGIGINRVIFECVHASHAFEDFAVFIGDFIIKRVGKTLKGLKNKGFYFVWCIGAEIEELVVEECAEGLF